MDTRLRRFQASVCLGLLLAIGCSEPRNVPAPAAAVGQPAPAVEPAPVAEAPPTPPPTREILGKKTQDVREAEGELAKGAQVGSTKIIAKDPITLPANAYVSIVGKTGLLNVQHAIDLYNAENGHYPKDYQEFRDEVLKVGKPDGIVLPQLPYYQEYGYDAAEHKLIILEYPDRKAQQGQK
jgi:hypothetical protein